MQFIQAAAAEGRDKHCIQNAPDPLENPRTEWIQRMNRKYAAPFSLEPQPYPNFESSFIAANMSASIEVCPAGSCLEPLRSNKNQHFGPIQLISGGLPVKHIPALGITHALPCEFQLNSERLRTSKRIHVGLYPKQKRQKTAQPEKVEIEKISLHNNVPSRLPRRLSLNRPAENRTS